MFGGAYVQREICISNPIGLAYSWKKIYHFWFILPSTSLRGGLYSEGRFNGGFVCVTGLGGLYLEGVIHGGAYFRNFTVSYNNPLRVHVRPHPRAYLWWPFSHQSIRRYCIQCCVRQAQKRENLEMNGTRKDFIQSVIQEGRKKKPKYCQQESNLWPCVY